MDSEFLEYVRANLLQNIEEVLGRMVTFEIEVWLGS